MYSKRSGGHRLPRFTGRRQSRRPEREWVALTPTLTSTASTSASTQILAFEAPALVSGTPLTADPPEDRIIQRIIARFRWAQVTTGNTVACGVILTDRTWTPIGTTTIVPDLDKRWLWWREFFIGSGESWDTLTGTANGSAVPMAQCHNLEESPLYLDIAPKVRIEDGKSLNFVIYNAAATAVTVVPMAWRILLSKAGRS